MRNARINISVFGSTGSIGRNTLEVVRRNPEQFALRYLSGNCNADLMIAQVREFRPKSVCVSNSESFDAVQREVGDTTEVLFGHDGLMELARRDDYETLVSSLVGFAGLLPTVAAIESGHGIALANKETLVVAGEVITGLVRRHRVPLVPIDSEHSAILQCLVGEEERTAARIILTASGGPFRGMTRRELEHVTVEQALQHPNWSMGSKITIDSSTMMNKGLEVIEARWLFDVPGDAIDVVVHPQSIIHSMVEFSDGSVKAQLGLPDMKLPIQYALSWPGRLEADYPRLDLAAIGELTFEKPDLAAFPCLRIAYDALKLGGTAPAVMNAANEIAVEAFLGERLPYLGIPRTIEAALNAVQFTAADSIEAVVEADALGREAARNIIEQ